jgi:hypothetical protein
MKRIMSLNAFKSGRVTKNKQDGSREFISLLACVSAIGIAIPPLLVYKGSGDIMDSWVKGVDEDSGTYFTSSPNGWSSNALGLCWLQNIFERHTKPSSTRTRRLLIVDGHSSHVNMEFINWADEHRIIIMILPPHTTHRLQPLDVGLFQPLSTAYSNELDDLMSKGAGYVTMKKRLFFPMFKRAWDKSFTKENIQHAFQKPGIWPCNGDEMIRKVTRPPPVPEIRTNAVKTPYKPQTIRTFRQAFDKSPSKERIEKLFKATEEMATRVDILAHEVKGLREALVLEKQGRKKGRKLNLCGEASQGVEVYSPAKVARARMFQEEKDAREADETKAKENRKIQREKNRELKAAQDAERQLHRDLRSANRILAKSPLKKSKAVAVKPRKAPPKVPKAGSILKLSKTATVSQNPPPHTNQIIDAENKRVDNQREGRRRIILPQRFRV